MPIVVVSKRSRSAIPADAATLVLDVTSRSGDRWQRFSPFYPHGGIPVPFSPGYSSETVEGIWQGLKVFERADVDVSRFRITSMKGLKRTARTYGRVLGHRQGVHGDRLLGYLEARRAIYLPAYRWVLDNCLQGLVQELRSLSRDRPLILLDYTSNGDVDNPTRPLSHAALIKCHLEGEWPMPETHPEVETLSGVR